MDITHLKYICAVESEKSISKAAAKLFVAQPYLSRIIKEVENELNFTIFTRTKSGVFATAEGEEFIAQSRQVLAQYERLLEQFSPSPDKIRYLTVATVRSSHIFEAFIEYLYRIDDDSKRRIRYNESNFSDVINQITTCFADVGVVYCAKEKVGLLSDAMAKRGIAIEPIGSLKFYLVVSKNHPLAQKNRPIRANELYDYGMVRHGDSPTNSEEIGSSPFANPDIIDIDRLKKIISITDRAGLLNIISYTDFFCIGVQGFQAQESMFNIVSLPLELDEELDNMRTVPCILTLSGRNLTEDVKLYINTLRTYFERYDED